MVSTTGKVLQYAGILGSVVLLVGLGWLSAARMRESLTAAAIDAYQQTEMEIVRSVARSIEHFVEDRLGLGASSPGQRAIEQDMFRSFVDPVRLLENGDAWVYAPDHVVFDVSGDFPDLYRGKSMAQIFEIQRAMGAWHYEEMTEAVTAARAGVGWYVWLPEKGREIAAWTPVRAGPYVWTVGLSTPLPEILRSTGATRQIRSSYLLVAVATALAVALLTTWAFAETGRTRSEALTAAQKELSSALNTMTDMEKSLGLCLSAARRLSGLDIAAVYLQDARTGALDARAAAGVSPSLAGAVSHFGPESLQTRLVGEGRARFTPDADLLGAQKEWPPELQLRTIGIAPLLHHGAVVGCLAVGSLSSVRFTPFAKRAVEAVAAVTGGMVARLRSEDSLRESEQRFRSVVDTARDAIIAADQAGRIVLWSAGAAAIFGHDAAAAKGMPLEALLAPPLAGERATEAPGGVERRVAIRSDGQRFPAEISWAEWAGRDGVYRTCIIRDMSDHERAEAEKRALEERLERAQRMQALGVLAGGVAHDLNNLLTPVIGYADLMIQELEPSSAILEPLERLREAGERAGAVVQDLLTLGRRGSYQMSVIDLNECVRGFLATPAVAEARARFPKVVFGRSLCEGVLCISGSPPHLVTVFLNLLLNACEAMPGGGQLAIRTARRTLASPEAGYETIEPGQYAVLEVTDSGVGIAEQDLGRVFEPFYTKKVMGRSGTGLGLAVVYGVVHDHNGRIDVRTAPGRGTSIFLWFPLASGEIGEAAGGAARLTGEEKVLVVEDQAEQRALVERLLQRFGYAVTAVGSGREAVAYVREHAVDIVVLDMIMEDGMDGLDCYREILVRHPGQKAIILSGYAETSRVKEAQLLGAGSFLRKPYRIDALAQAIREELDRR